VAQPVQQSISPPKKAGQEQGSKAGDSDGSAFALNGGQLPDGLAAIEPTVILVSVIALQA
tara:strand:+ start:347 stop:526 length:180 start_codon:yes stop_codon:yes gene_type:complete